MQCKYCAHKFTGGASRVRHHFTNSKAGAVGGVVRCTAEEWEIQGIVAELRAIEDAAAEKQDQV